MFTAVFAFALITVHVAAEIPSYIHVCGRKDPNLDQCILNNVENLKYKICEGIPELDIQPNNPLHLNQLPLLNVSGVYLAVMDTTMMGLCDYDVNFFHVDIDALHFDIDLLFKHIQINGTYDLDLRTLVSIAHKALVYITTDNVGAKVSADMDTVTKNGKKYVFISKMTLNLDIKGFYIELERNQNQLRQIIRNFVGNNQEEIIRSVKPILENVISRWTISLSNNITKHFTYEELFPDRV